MQRTDNSRLYCLFFHIAPIAFLVLWNTFAILMEVAFVYSLKKYLKKLNQLSCIHNGVLIVPTILSEQLYVCILLFTWSFPLSKRLNSSNIYVRLQTFHLNLRKKLKEKVKCLRLHLGEESNNALFLTEQIILLIWIKIDINNKTISRFADLYIVSSSESIIRMYSVYYRSALQP